MDLAPSKVQQHPAYQELVRKRTSLSRTLSAAILVIYFGFIFLVALAPHLMGMPIAGIITLGFPLGLFVILAAIALTGIYVQRANTEFDALTRQIVKDNG